MMRLIKILSELLNGEEWVVVKTPYSEGKIISPRFMNYLVNKYKAYIISQNSTEYMLRSLPLHIHLVYNHETGNFGLYNKIQDCYIKNSGSKTAIGCIQKYLQDISN